MSNDMFSNMSDYFCSSCGAEVIEGNKFCSRCGTPVQRTATEAASVSESSVSAVSGSTITDFAVIGSPDSGSAASGFASSGPAVYGPAASYSVASAQTVGAPVTTVQAAPPPPVVRQQVTAPLMTDADFIPDNKSKYQPISTGGYIGIWLLMMLPAINLLLLIVWACGGCRKINKRNYARSMLVISAIFLVLGVILTIIFKNALNNLIPLTSPYGSF